MVVLIVDDQINVVSGTYFGINWDKIGVDKVLKAYNVSDAKEILTTNIVDIVLCDIEMPSENGLSLLRWIREMKLDIECIMLTAHADFLYVKEAMQLDSFDYILQPARYEEIELSIEKAIDRLLSKRESTALSSYGILLFEDRNRVLQALLKDSIHKEKPDFNSIASIFKQFTIPITLESNLRTVLLHFYEPDSHLEVWGENLLIYAVNNVINELLLPIGQAAFCIKYTGREIILLLYSPDNSAAAPEILRDRMEKFVEFMLRHLKLTVSCYVSDISTLKEFPEKMHLLKKCEKDNVAQKAIVQFASQSSAHTTHNGIDPPKIPYPDNNWDSITGIGNPADIFLSVKSLLAEQENDLDAKGLRHFYHNFIQVLSSIAGMNGLTLGDIFDSPELNEISLSAAHSVENMRKLINFADEYFRELEKSRKGGKKQIEQIILYIREHLSEDIRRSDIAKAVYLSPNYISRLFHNEMNMSLKDYILNEKIKLARSMIQTTNLPISIIATKVGYTNFSYFSQVYKKIVGNSPGAERGAERGSERGAERSAEKTEKP